MGMRGRIALLAATVGLGACARLNPAFGDEAVGASNGQSATSESALETTDGTVNDAGTSGSPSGSTDADSTGTGAAPLSTTGDSSSGDTDESGSVEPTSALLWISDLTMGDWALSDGSECALALENSQDLCAEPPFEIVGRSKAPLVSLPEFHPFLQEAEFVSARTGEFVLASFADLLDGWVEPVFVSALLPEGDQMDVFAWRGPVDDLENSCVDWTVPSGNVPGWFFEQGSETVSFNVSAPCMSELRLLCTCPARS